MPRMHPPFGRILIAAILAQALLMAVTLAYMLAYSRFIAPGHTADHGAIAAPLISIVAGAVIFFMLAQWLGKHALERRTLSALLFWLLFVLISGGVAIGFFGWQDYQADAPITAVAHVVKLVAALFGARASVGVRSIAS